MRQSRIVKRTCCNGQVVYVIQVKHFLFRCWADAWTSRIDGVYFMDTFPTLEEARRNVCYFDGTPARDEVVENCKERIV